MFFQLRAGNKNNQGIVLIIVLIILMVMAIFSMTLFSQSMSETRNTRSQTDEIIAEQLAKGAFSVAFNTVTPSGAINPLPQTVFVLNGRTYSVIATNSSGNILASVVY